MNRLTRAMLRAGTVVVAAVAVVTGVGAAAAIAHPLGNFTVNRYTGSLVSPDHVLLDHVLDFAEIPTAQFGDQIKSLPELAARECDSERHNLAVTVAGDRVALRSLSARGSLGTGQANLPLLRVECLLRGDFPALRGSTDVTVVDTSAGRQIGWREMTARADKTTMVHSDVSTDTISARLSSYPRDLLSSPLDQRSAALVVRPGGPPGTLETSTGGPPATDEASGVNRFTEWIAGLLDEPGTGIAALTLLAALALGATHAVAPGHGKTVMAFYLVDQHRRSVRTAFSVGLTVTLAHTASVLGLGLLITAGSTLFSFDRIYPWLTAASGVLILVLGVALLRAALRGKSAHDHGHGHAHGHGHGHGHEHGGHGHVHGDTAPGSRRSSVITLGIAGGLVPSPSALIILLAATAVGRPWFGALAVLAFGVGMALTLMAAGLLASGLTQRLQALTVRSTSQWARLVRAGLAYGAAGGVCLVGAGLVLRAALTI